MSEESLRRLHRLLCRRDVNLSLPARSVNLNLERSTQAYSLRALESQEDGKQCGLITVSIQPPTSREYFQHTKGLWRNEQIVRIHIDIELHNFSRSDTRNWCFNELHVHVLNLGRSLAPSDEIVQSLMPRHQQRAGAYDVEPSELNLPELEYDQ